MKPKLRKLSPGNQNFDGMSPAFNLFFIKMIHFHARKPLSVTELSKLSLPVTPDIAVKNDNFTMTNYIFDSDNAFGDFLQAFS